MNKVTEFRKEVNRCLELANAKYNMFELINNQCIYKTVDIKFYVSDKGDAGWASYFYECNKIKKLILRFNSYFIETEYDYMVYDTIPHEIAHLLCYLLYPNEKIGHNNRWNEICINLGGTGRRYHSMTPMKKITKIKYEYNVDNQIVYLLEKDHFKAQKSFTNYPVNSTMVRIFKNMFTGTIIKG